MVILVFTAAARKAIVLLAMSGMVILAFTAAARKAIARRVTPGMVIRAFTGLRLIMVHRNTPAAIWLRRRMVRH